MILYRYIDVVCDERAPAVGPAATPSLHATTSAHTISRNAPARVLIKHGDTPDHANLQDTTLTTRGNDAAA